MTLNSSKFISSTSHGKSFFVLFQATVHILNFYKMQKAL